MQVLCFVMLCIATPRAADERKETIKLFYILQLITLWRIVKNAETRDETFEIRNAFTVIVTSVTKIKSFESSTDS